MDFYVPLQKQICPNTSLSKVNLSNFKLKLKLGQYMINQNKHLTAQTTVQARSLHNINAQSPVLAPLFTISETMLDTNEKHNCAGSVV